METVGRRLHQNRPLGRNHLQKPDREAIATANKTPKALANWSPGLERSDNPGLAFILFTINLFLSIRSPGFSLRSNPGLQLANAFGVIHRSAYSSSSSSVRRRSSALRT